MAFDAKLRYVKVKQDYALDAHLGSLGVYRRIRGKVHPAQWQVRSDDAVIASAPTLSELTKLAGTLDYKRNPNPYALVGKIDGTIPVYKRIRGYTEHTQYWLRTRHGKCIEAASLIELFARAEPYL